ncbi:MAG: hypothetical protein MJ189_04635 [Coriobacteriales bacterium]|nr:hypothetical protein [Coriobacteriales bacterium]
MELQTIKERHDDTSFTNKQLEAERGEKNGFKLIDDHQILVFDLEEPKILKFSNVDGELVDSPLSSVFLGDRDLSSSTSNEYFDKYKDLNGKKVYMTIDLDKLGLPGGITGYGCEGFPGVGCIIEVGE